ncbi:MAG: M28 family peptidase [Myxococcales bacterium]|nr:M28 family peptidase [Myxococcales bacterium]
MKLLIALSLVGVGAALVYGMVQPWTGSGARWDGPRADPRRLRESVLSLVALGPRHDEAGMARTADWILAQLAALGLAPIAQEYRFANGGYRNVTVRFGPGTAQRIVVGAHYDVRGPYAGADDNSSGTAGLLELARLLRDKPPPMQAELVFYPREEVDGMGSEVHARSLLRSEVRAMIVLEMIGTFSGRQTFPFAALGLLYPSEGNYIVVAGRPRDLPLTRTVKRALASAGIPVESINAPEAIPGIGDSDHRNYWQQGMTAVMVTDTAWYRNPRYHTAQDTPDTLDYARMAQVVEGTAAAVHALAIPR